MNGQWTSLFYHTFNCDKDAGDLWKKTLRQPDQSITPRAEETSLGDDPPEVRCRSRRRVAPAEGSEDDDGLSYPERGVIRDANSKAYWRRVRSLSRENRQRQEARDRQMKKSELEERRRRERILAERKKERDALMIKFLREPLQQCRSKTMKENARTDKKPRDGDNGENESASSGRLSQSVPDLDEAFMAAKGEDQMLDARAQAFLSPTMRRRQYSEEKNQPLIDDKICDRFLRTHNPRIPPHTPGQAKRRGPVPPTRPFPPGSSDDVIRENQKPYPTRPPEELRDKGRHRRRRSFGENSLKMGTTKVLSDTFTITNDRSKIESVLADYKPNLDSHIMVLPKPRLDRRSSMPDLRDFRCISSAVVYETIATLSSLGNARGLMVLPPCDHPSDIASSQISTPEILPGKHHATETTPKTPNKWTKQVNNYIQEETRAVLSCSPLIGRLSPFVDQLGLQKGRKTQRKEWVSKHASLKNLQKQILPTFSDSASQTDITRPISAVRHRRNSLGSEGNDSVYYDSLEEDDSRSSSHSSTNKAFYVPIKNDLSPNMIAAPSLPARLTARLEERKRTSNRRPLPNPLSPNNLALTGKKMQVLNEIALAQLASEENEKDVSQNSSNLSVVTLRDEVHASSDSDILDSPKVIETINNGKISPETPDHSAETSLSDITQTLTPVSLQKRSSNVSIDISNVQNILDNNLASGKSNSHSESASVQYSDTYTAVSQQSSSSSSDTRPSDESTLKDDLTRDETLSNGDLSKESTEANIYKISSEEGKANTNTDSVDMPNNIDDSENKNEEIIDTDIDHSENKNEIIGTDIDHSENKNEVIDTDIDHSENKNEETIDTDIDHSENKTEEIIDTDIDHSENKNEETVRTDIDCSEKKNEEIIDTDIDHSEIKNEEIIDTDIEHSEYKSEEIIDTDIDHSEIKNEEIIDTDIEHSEYKSEEIIDTDIDDSENKNEEIIDTDIDHSKNKSEELNDTEISMEALPKEASDSISDLPINTSISETNGDGHELQNSVSENIKSENYDDKYDTDSFHSVSNTLEKSEDDISEAIDSLDIQNDENDSEIEIQITASEVGSNDALSEADDISENISSVHNDVSEDIPPKSSDEAVEEVSSSTPQDQLEIFGYTSSGKEALLESGFIDYDDTSLMPDSPTTNDDNTKSISGDEENKNINYVENETSNNECFEALERQDNNLANDDVHEDLEEQNEPGKITENENGDNGSENFVEENPHCENSDSNVSQSNENEIPSINTETDVEQEELSDGTDSWDRITVIRAPSTESNTGSRNDTPDMDNEFSLNAESEEFSDDVFYKDQANDSRLTPKENKEGKADLLEEIFGNLTPEEGKQTPVDENSSGLSTIAEDDEPLDVTLTEPSEEELLMSDDDRKEESEISVVELKMHGSENGINDIVSKEGNPSLEDDNTIENFSTTEENKDDTETESEAVRKDETIVNEESELNSVDVGVRSEETSEMKTVKENENVSEENKIEDEIVEEITTNSESMEDSSNSEEEKNNFLMEENKDIYIDLDETSSKNNDVSLEVENKEPESRNEKSENAEVTMDENIKIDVNNFEFNDEKESQGGVPDPRGEFENAEVNLNENISIVVDNFELNKEKEPHDENGTSSGRLAVEDIKPLDTFREKIENDSAEEGTNLHVENENDIVVENDDLDDRLTGKYDEDSLDKENKTDNVDNGTELQESEISDHDKDNLDSESKYDNVDNEIELQTKEMAVHEEENKETNIEGNEEIERVKESDVHDIQENHTLSDKEEVSDLVAENLTENGQNCEEYSENVVAMEANDEQGSNINLNEGNEGDSEALSKQVDIEITVTAVGENEEEAWVIEECPEVSMNEVTENSLKEENKDILENEDMEDSLKKAEENYVRMSENSIADDFSNEGELSILPLNEGNETVSLEISESIIEEDLIQHIGESIIEQEHELLDVEKGVDLDLGNENDKVNALHTEIDSVLSKNYIEDRSNGDIELQDEIFLEENVESKSEITSEEMCNGIVNGDNDAVEIDETDIFASSAQIISENLVSENGLIEDEEICLVTDEDETLVNHSLLEDVDLIEEMVISADDEQENSIIGNHVLLCSSDDEDCSDLTQNSMESSSQNGKDKLSFGVDSTLANISCLMPNVANDTESQEILGDISYPSSDYVDNKSSEEVVMIVGEKKHLTPVSIGSTDEDSSIGLHNIVENKFIIGNACDNGNENFDQGDLNEMSETELIDELSIGESLSDTESNTVTAVENLVPEVGPIPGITQNTHAEGNGEYSIDTLRDNKGDMNDNSLEMLKSNAVELVDISISKAVSSLSICTDEMDDETGCTELINKDSMNEPETLSEPLECDSELTGVESSMDEEGENLRQQTDATEVELQVVKHNQIYEIVASKTPEDINKHGSNSSTLKDFESKRGRHTIVPLDEDPDKDMEDVGLFSLNCSDISEGNETCNNNKTNINDDIKSKAVDNDDMGTDKNLFGNNQESESEISDLSILSSATQDVTEPIALAEYEELLDHGEGVREKKVFVGYRKISRNFSSSQMIAKQELNNDRPQNNDNDQCLSKDHRDNTQKELFCPPEDTQKQKGIHTKEEDEDREVRSVGAHLPESFLEEEAAYFDDDSPRNRSNHGGAAVNSPSSDSGVMEMLGKNEHSPIEGSKEEALEDQVSLKESPQSERSGTKVHGKKSSSKKAKDRANRIASARRRPVSARDKELDVVETISKKDRKSMQSSFEDLIASEKSQIASGGAVSHDDYHNLLYQTENDTSQSKYQLVQDYLDRLPNHMHSKDESPLVTVGSPHRSNDGMQTDNLSEFGSSESGGESYSERLLKALEARRTRRHRPPSSNIDHEESSRNYRPPSLSALDAFLATLSQYRGGRETSEDSRDDTPSPSIPSGADDVTVHVRAGPRHHDVRVSSRRQVRLVVNVSNPGPASDSGFAPETERASRREAPSSERPVLNGYHRGRRARDSRPSTATRNKVVDSEVDQLLSDVREYLNKKLKRSASMEHSAAEGDQADIFVEGSNIEKCFKDRPPAGNRTKLYPKPRSKPEEPHRRRPPAQSTTNPILREQQKIQSSISAINALLKQFS